MKNLSDYSEFSLSELINKISTSRYWNLPKMLAEALRRLIPQEPKYKVYTALLTQSGTDAPVATVLENTLGDIVWGRDNEGEYFAISEGLFTEGKVKTFVNFQHSPLNDFMVTFDFYPLDNNTIALDADKFDGLTSNFTGSDDIAYNLSIEIRVYN